MASKIYPSVRPEDGSSRLNANEIAMAGKSPAQVFKSGIIQDVKHLTELGKHKAAQDLYKKHFKD